MLVYGAMLGCLDPVLTVAAALAHGRPILLSGPPDQQKDLARARAPILEAGTASRSDHIVLVAAYNGWARARAKGRRAAYWCLHSYVQASLDLQPASGGMGSELRSACTSYMHAGGRSASYEYCQQYQLSESSLEAVQAGRVEYANTLADLGFISRGDVSDLQGRGWGKGAGSVASASSPWLSRPVNRNWENARFTKAAICAGFYPSILRVQHPKPKFKEVRAGRLL